MTKSPDAFRTISEVAEWLGIQAHVLRFWESKFTHVKPVKRAGGRRYYRPADMVLIGGIKKLLHDDGLTIKGVQKILREQGVAHVSSLSQPLDDAPVEPAANQDETVISFARATRDTDPGPDESAVMPASVVSEPAPQEPAPQEPETPEPDRIVASQEPIDEVVAQTAPETELLAPMDAPHETPEPEPEPETIDVYAPSIPQVDIADPPEAHMLDVAPGVLTALSQIAGLPPAHHAQAREIVDQLAGLRSQTRTESTG